MPTREGNIPAGTVREALTAAGQALAAAGVDSPRLDAELTDCEVTATDISEGALELARDNAARLGIDGRVRFERGTVPLGGSFDLALANLPYVSEAELPRLPPEIARYEPREAVVAG